MNAVATGQAVAGCMVALGALAAAIVIPAPAVAQVWFDRSPPPPPAYSAQAEVAELSLRIDRLEELVRRLNGEIEELRFQLQSGSGQGLRLSEPAAELPPKARAAAPRPADVVPEPVAVTPLPGSVVQPLASAHPSATVATGGPTSLLPPSPYLPDGAEAFGAPPQPLGTIPQSALQGPQESLAAPAFTPGPTLMPGPMSTVAGLAADGSEEAYNGAYGFLLQQDFAAAEYSFAKFLDDYPDHQLSGNAQYWLAESFYARRQYRRAAQEFLKGYQTYSTSPKAPDSLLKLGMTLAALGQKDQACVSFAEVATKFPRADQEVRDRAVAEHQRGGC